MTPDQLNASFELAGAAFLWLSILKLWKDKLVRGLSWWHVGFFFFWGAWNLYYYPSLDQWWSFAAGLVMAVSNGLYLAGLIFYTLQEKINGNS